MKKNVIFFCLFLLILPLFSQNTKKNNWPVLKGPYLGQKPPGMKPEIFAPGIISKGYSEYAITFTPNGKELYLWLGENRPAREGIPFGPGTSRRSDSMPRRISVCSMRNTW